MLKDNRNDYVNMRINQDDKKFIKMAADKKGVTFTTYMISAAMNKAKRDMK